MKKFALILLVLVIIILPITALGDSPNGQLSIEIFSSKSDSTTSDSSSSSDEIKKDTSQNQTDSPNNQKPQLLPSTGSKTGTLVYYLGNILVLLSLFSYMLLKKHQEKKRGNYDEKK